MKNPIVFKICFLLCLSFLFPFSLLAYDVEIDRLCYTLNKNDNTAEVSSYNFGNEKNVSISIPTEIQFDGKKYVVMSIGNAAFSDCMSLSSLFMSHNVTSIGDWAFRSCENLESISIPAVTSIGRGAFFGCKKINTFLLPEGLQKIGGKAFNDCEKIKTINIPSSVHSIDTSDGGNPFIGCSSLTSIIVDSGNITYDSRDNCNAIILTSYNTLIAGCQNTIIPPSVTSIYSFAFCKCSSLKTITLPNSLTRIREAAFEGCNNLSTVVSEIDYRHSFSLDDHAFYGIPSNSVLYVPKGTISSFKFRKFLTCQFYVDKVQRND